METKNIKSLNHGFEQMKITSRPNPNKGVLVEKSNLPPTNRCRHKLCTDATPHEWADCRHNRNRRGKNHKPKKPPNVRERNDGGGRGGRGGRGGNPGRGNHGNNNRGSGSRSHANDNSAGGNDAGSKSRAAKRSPFGCALAQYVECGNAAVKREHGAPELVSSGAVGGSRNASVIDLSQSDDEEPAPAPSNTISSGTLVTLATTTRTSGLRIVNNCIDAPIPEGGREGNENPTPETRAKKNGSGNSSGRGKGGRRHGSGGGASGRKPEARAQTSSQNCVESPPRVGALKLIEGLPSINRAHDLRAACIRNGSMLRTVLAKMGHRGSLEQDDSKFGCSSSYDVVVEKSHVAAAGKQLKYSLVLESNCELSRFQKSRLRGIFAKHEAAGFLEWLGGDARGWRFESASWKRKFAIQLNSLQGVFSLFARDGQKYFFPKERKRMVWRKQQELTDIVSDIRVWIEILKSSDLTRRLLRNSGSGPDSPVHWAHHHPETDYPLTVVTESTMLELVEGVVKLFQQEFNHSADDPLGTRWRKHEKLRRSDFEDAAKVCPEWTEDHLERLLNHSPAFARNNGSWNAQF